LIPVIGISGAAIATFVTMTINAVLAWRLLSNIIIIQVNLNSLKNILKAGGVMSLLISGYRLIIPLSDVWLTLVPIFLGAIVYGSLLLKLDDKIYDELKKIAVQMNVVWPK